jgi:hypothetical protein
LRSLLISSYLSLSEIVHPIEIELYFCWIYSCVVALIKEPVLRRSSREVL